MKPNERCLQVRDVSEAFVCTNDARKHPVLNKPLERVTFLISAKLTAFQL